ncbi:peptidase S9 family protein [Gordonia hirsuta DSM 44140 = NBRC 16056]|uniref:Peptidase S9 family protein n=1 Tax=Gordonia hirsuta DSM 44140 = NBRC 16056 TaxID=1121927 RepID=L7LAC5_9ACTN|nr:prolyl oligopeptidase family serine peptidase [Gordonia hirsuta]GAC56963.1 peptidase S9 family protein [Gordonia hirsuta DSM 44140 = NBRC 16056]
MEHIETAAGPHDDPHLWLEDVTGEAALDWVRDHNQPTVDELTGSPRFEDLRTGALEVLDTEAKIPYVRRRGDYLYNFWRDARNPKGLWRRTTLESYRTDVPDWDVLIDVDALAAAEDENWVWAGVGLRYPDYDRALVSLSRGGADASVIREFDMTTRDWVAPEDGGFVLPEAKSSMSWIDRDTVYVGTDFSSTPDGEPALTTSGYPRTARRWTRGTPLDQAPTVFAGAVTDVAAGASYDHTPGFERHFVSRSTDFFNALEYQLVDGEPVLIDVPTDSVAAVHRDHLLVMPRSPWTVDGQSHRPGSLLLFDYPAYLAGDRSARVLFAPDDHTSLQDYAFTKSRLVLVTLHDVATRVEFLRLDDWTPAPITGLPELATLAVIGTDPEESDEIWLTASSFTQAPSLLHGDATTGVQVIKSTPEFFDADGVSTEQFFATSDDGTQIPYFVVRRTGPGGTDGPRPTLLYGYGGFGNSLLPGYSAIAGRSWISRGGIYVIANIRGGGEYGPHWHTQSQKAGRHLVYEDFAAVARDLVDRGLTTVDQLAAQGGSNGGLLMGVMATSYPELFGALVCQVPLIDMRRYHLLLAGASWMAEYGDPDDPEEWEFISAYSPYQRLRAQVRYPELLVTTSTRDDRVHPGHARKLVARLEELGHRPAYYENIEGGHGGAADNAQAAFKSALAYEFLWRTVGSAAGN